VAVPYCWDQCFVPHGTGAVGCVGWITVGSPTVSDLEAIIDRLQWSWDHLQRFKLILVEQGVGYHWTPLPKVKTESYCYIDFVIDEVTPLPDHLKFIIGDCIHSLRASLDNLIYLLCPTDYAEFPICKTSNQWESNARKIKALPEDPAKVLYDLQPFHPKNGVDPEWNPLWVLDRLWNDDKHRAPHMALGVTDTATIEFGIGGGDFIWFVMNTGPLDLGSKICRVWAPIDSEPDLVPHFAFEVAFDDFGPARGGSVYYSLVNLHQRVAEVVERFRPFFTG